MSESVDVGAQSTRQHHRTPYEPIQEVRFAVVLFGGVSLAVYINGVVQELLRLVRASAPDPSHPEPPLAMLDEGTEAPLVGSEKIYRQLAAYLPHGETGAHKIRTRFVIDVISGSSAGGINGIYLAKALTHNLGIQSLAELWEKEGDLDKLLNDKASYQGLDIAKEEPASLLNSRRMTWKLLEAFQSLHRPKAEKDHALVDELELLTTATDLRGRPVLLRVGDRKVYEQRHRHIFRFRFASGKGSKAQEVDQFADEFDPFLTFAARATSSFPVAFEPATLAEVEQILAKPKFAKYRQRKNSDIWRPLYQDYFDTLADFNKDGDADFRRVSFGDGGILDNKPFSRVVEAISERSGGMPVERKLIYVEPSPEHPEDKAWDPTSPSVLDNFFLSTIKLPGVETIREDLELLEVYQGLVRRAEIARLGQSDDISRSRYEEPERFRIEYEEWKKQDLRSMIDLFGIGYGPYHRLKVAHLMQKMASLLTTCWGWEPGSEIETALHEVMKVWRDRNYQIYRLEDPDPVLARLEVRQHDVRIRVENPDPQKKTENELVGELDLWWVLRRLRHVRERLGEVVVDTATLSDHLLHLFPELEPPEQSFTDDEMARARKKAQELSQSLGDIQREILTALESLGQATDDVFAKEQRPKYLERRLLEILQEAGTPRSKIERQGLAKGLLDDRYEGHLLTLGIEALVAKLKGLAAEIPSGSKRILKYAHAEIQVGPEIWVRPDLLVEKLR